MDSENKVAPLAGAWIEIREIQPLYPLYDVAPLAGAWIEIIVPVGPCGPCGSLPLRERGLKSGEDGGKYFVEIVAPLAGAWIEISQP